MSEKTLIQATYPQYIKTLLARTPSHFINGEWIVSDSGKTIEVFDPSSGKVISHLADASESEVNQAVAAARTAFDDGRWTRLPPIVREGLINKLADLLEANAQELAELEAVDNGKPATFAAQVDIPSSIGNLRYNAGWATKLAGETIDPLAAPSGAFHAYTRREPVGVTAQIVPWNFPLIMATMKIAPALAAGCTIVLKPAEQTSLTALRLADLIQEAGFPPGVINVITGLGHTAGDQLVRHPDVDKVAFTGSTEIGKIINCTATETMKNVTLELGGKSPVIVMPDMDIETAVNGATGAIFYNSGQLCVAGSRLFAHSSIFDKVLEGIAEAAQHWSPAASLCPSSNLGPLVSAEQQKRVMGYIEAGKKEGATVLTGGDAPNADGYYLNPTVLVDVDPSMTPVREEIFGPVLVAQRFDDIDEVLAAANNTEFGLGASVWTKDLSTMHKLAAGIKSGTVWGNCHAMIDPALPFGGYKQSGIGREQARQGVEAYTELKSVIIAL